MRIGELARQAGLATSALRYYESIGLLPEAERTDAGYRLYDEAAVGRLGFIRRAQSLGLTVAQIRQLLEGPELGRAEERERIRHAVAHRLAETDRRLAELTALKSELEGLYVRLSRSPGPDCGHLGDCACWLPNEEEVIAMNQDVRCCEQECCPECCSPGCCGS